MNNINEKLDTIHMLAKWRDTLLTTKKDTIILIEAGFDLPYPIECDDNINKIDNLIKKIEK